MEQPLPGTGLALLLAGFAAGCAGGDRAPEPDPRRLMLNEGYSLLYVDAGHLAQVKLILYVKFESAAFEAAIAAVAEFGGELKRDLERIAADYPDVRIDLDPLPEMEQRKRWALGMDRARQFAPGVGRGGREYERTVLIGLANGINHERHLCQVMADEEPDAGLRKFLAETRRRYGGLYERIVALLEQEHYRDPDGKAAG